MNIDEGDQRRYAPIDIQRLRAENANLERRGRWLYYAAIDGYKALGKAQEKLLAIKRRTCDLHRRSGHPDSACLRCLLYDFIIDESTCA